MTQDWKYITDKMAKETPTNVNKAMKLSLFHDTALQTFSGSMPLRLPLYTRHHPLHVAFVNGYIIPLIMVAAVLVFMWGMFQYFILGGTSDEKREKGKQLLIWGIIGFVLMLSIQGIVMLFADSLGFGGTITPPSTFKI